MAIYITVCGFLYFYQESLLFYPQKLAKNYRFMFSGNFEEINIKTDDGTILNGLLFKSDSSKGLIFYLHGNAGSLSSWGESAKTFTDLKYDVFMLDYRGYGKSNGDISGQQQLFSDVQTVYEQLMKKYSENKIIILGYSMGTGLAAKLAADNSPKLLILQAPYFSLVDLMKHTFPVIPTFILKYKFETNIYIKNCHMPIVIFHGNKDEVIYYGSSLKLNNFLKAPDTLITLNGQGHNNMSVNSQYQAAIKEILMKYQQ